MIRNTLTLLLPMIGEVAVLAIALRRGCWRRFPVFCGYFAWIFLCDLLYLRVEWGVSADAYFRLFYIGFPIDWAVRFLVLTEVVLAVWKRQQTTRSRRLEFVLVLMLFAGMDTLGPIAQLFAPSAMHFESALYGRLDALLSLLVVVCWLMLEGLQRQLSFSRMDLELPILRGLGVNAVVSLSTGQARRTLSSEWHSMIDVLQTGSYLAVLIYWMFCLSRSMPTLDDAEA